MTPSPSLVSLRPWLVSGRVVEGLRLAGMRTNQKAAESEQLSAASVTTLNTSDTALATGVPVNEHVRKHLSGGETTARALLEDPVTDIPSQGEAENETLFDPGEVIHYSRGREKFDNYPEQRTAATFDDFAKAVLSDMSARKGLAYICGPLAQDDVGKHHRCRDGALDKRFLSFDLDKSTPESFAGVCKFMLGFRAFGYTTASHTAEAPRARFILELSRAVDRGEGMRIGAALQKLIEDSAGADVKFDPSVYRGEQPVFTPPVGTAAMHYTGAPVDVDVLLKDAPPLHGPPGLKERSAAIAGTDPVVRVLTDKGMVKKEHASGKLSIICPFDSEHTEPGGDSSTVYLLPHFNGVPTGKFRCFHAHCENRTQEEFRAVLGFTDTSSGRANGKGVCVTLIRGTTIQPKPIQWEWKNWLARGMFHIQAGAPGGGKTTIGISFAATVTVGGKWPDGTPCPIGDVLIWSGEDNPEYILLPRFLAAGGDPGRVYFIDGVTDSRGKRSFDPATDIEGLLEAIRGLPNLSYVMIDPVVNAVLGDGNKNAEVRRALQPLVDLAAERNVVLFGITHFSKGTAGRDPVERVNGSVAFGALPRVVMAAAKVRERDENGEEIERRIFCRTKSNIGPDTGGWEYKLALTDVPGYPEIMVTRVVWGKELTGSARELLAEAEAGEPEERGDLEACKEFLRGLLSGGPVLRNQVKVDAEGAVHAWRTVERAKKALGVISEKAGMKGGWAWRLPPAVEDIL